MSVFQTLKSSDSWDSYWRVELKSFFFQWSLFYKLQVIGRRNQTCTYWEYLISGARWTKYCSAFEVFLTNSILMQCHYEWFSKEIIFSVSALFEGDLDGRTRTCKHEEKFVQISRWIFKYSFFQGFFGF